MSTPRELATRYFNSWRTKDFTALREILADDCSFRGPLGTASNADECVAGLRGMAEHVMQDVDVQVMVVEGDDVITWFELHTAAAPPAPTANWMHVVDGKIARIRVTFDPRAILGE